MGVSPFDLDPVADALAERGRVVVRRAYADWSNFDADRRLLARAQVELIEIPQFTAAARKNAADIKMAVDAIELAYERGFITTFAIATGDSDFTPLVHKLRELDKRVIGIGVQSSTSALLPPACDEFLFYDRLPGIESAQASRRGQELGRQSSAVNAGGASRVVADGRGDNAVAAGDEHDVGPRAILRKDPTFDEADLGFRGFGELLRHLESQRVVQLRPGPAQGDPEVTFPEG